MKIKQQTRNSLFFNCASTLLVATVMGACAHAPKAAVSEEPLPALKPVRLDHPVQLRLNSEVGRIDKVRYLNHALIEQFENGDLREKRDENLEFLSQTETLKVDPIEHRLTQIMTTIHKDGKANLHDYAMPETDEKLDMVVTDQGQILKSGNHSKQSLFYIPTVSVPENPVEVGDTWTMSGSWYTEQGVQMHLELLSILKGFVECGKADQCADIEMSGEVFIKPDQIPNLIFKNTWTGRQYFALHAGLPIWSRVVNNEGWSAETTSRRVRSCMEARVVEPQDYVVPGPVSGNSGSSCGANWQPAAGSEASL